MRTIKTGTVMATSLLTLSPIAAGLLLWNKLPETIATHWGADGTADGFSSKAFAVFGLPLILLALHLLCIAATAHDPKNKEQNGKVFGMTLWIVPIISLFVGGVVYSAALGMALKMHILVCGLMGLMFLVLGNYLPKCKQNHTIGIKIKWTLENEANWNATHRFCGRLWFAGGVLILGCMFLPEAIGMVVTFVILTALCVVPIVYSYRYSKKT